LLSAGFGFLELFEYRAPAQPAQELSEAYRLGVRHICFEVEDPDSALEAVVDQGGSMMNAPESVPGGGRAVYCRDPFGNLLEFTTSGGRMPSVSDAAP
jgi:catechol 2,3-dioxygenase-like lactoylglutathione lyase family enzyme